MKLEDQVVSLELAKKLKELTIKQDSLFVWIHPFGHKEQLKDFFDEDMSKWILYSSTKLAPFTVLKNREKYAAHTVAELGEILPEQILHGVMPTPILS